MKGVVLSNMMLFKSKKISYYIRTEDKLSENINPLIDIVINKCKKYQIWKQLDHIQYIYFLRNFYTPSYAFLSCIYDFICTAENVYMYPNDKKNHIFAYRNLKKGVKSFCITKNSLYTLQDEQIRTTYTIEYTLFANSDINIVIKRDWGEKIITNISFKDGQDLLLSDTDQILFNTIIINTMNTTMDLVESIYDMSESIELRGGEEKDCFSHIYKI